MTCGMPFVGAHANDIGLDTPDGSVCIYDTKEGQIKTAKEIFEGGVQFFMTEATDGNRELAEKITRKNMHALPYWQNHPFAELSGPEATDQEFGETMAKL